LTNPHELAVILEESKAETIRWKTKALDTQEKLILMEIELEKLKAAFNELSKIFK